MDDSTSKKYASKITESLEIDTMDTVESSQVYDGTIYDDSLLFDTSEEVEFDESNLVDSSLLKEILWHGDIITVYPLDYHEIDLVKWQILTCLVMFSVFGLNDQTTGSLIPTLTAEYGVSTVTVSNIFLVQMLGYTLASVFNDKIHRKVGMRGAIIGAAISCIVFFGILSSKPSSIYIYICCNLPLGLAIGLLDCTANVLIGNLITNKNEWMGILHGLYGAAAMVTPPLVTMFVERGKWTSFFLIPSTLALIGLFLCLYSFKHETAAKYDYACSIVDDESQTVGSGLSGERGEPESFLNLFKNPAILLYALFLFFYLGAEISTGSWLFTYLLATKSDNKMRMSYVTATFWTGLTVGRLTLGFVTKRIFHNEYRASYTYGILTLCLYTLLVLIGLIDLSSLTYAISFGFVTFLCGVFIGPLFPNASIVAIQILPKKLHVAGVGTAVAVGGCGAAFFPYIVGILTHHLGISIFPLLCWMLVLVFISIWDIYPRFIKNQEEYL